jgi:hypothetical protein
MTSYEQELSAIHQIMADQCPDTQLGYKLDRILAEMDELCALAIEKPELVEGHLKNVGYIMCRAQLVLSEVEARHPMPFRLVGRTRR